MPEKNINLWYLLTGLVCLEPLLETKMLSSFRKLSFFKKQNITELITKAESQNGWDWKEALKVIWSNFPVQAQPPATGNPGLCPDCCWISQKEISTDFLNSLCQCSVKSVFWCSEGASCVSICSHCLWSCHRAPLLDTKQSQISQPFFHVWHFLILY